MAKYPCRILPPISVIMLIKAMKIACYYIFKLNVLKLQPQQVVFS